MDARLTLWKALLVPLAVRPQQEFRHSTQKAAA
jgi:hypothetical protein